MMRKGATIAIVVSVVLIAMFIAVTSRPQLPPFVFIPQPQPREIYKVSVNVIDTYSKQPVEANIYLMPLQDQTTSAHALISSHLEAFLEEGDYEIRVEATGYFIYYDTITVDKNATIIVELWK